MELEKLWPDSSNIEKTKYRPIASLLEVTFKTGKTYQYSPVPVELWLELLQAPSIGKFFSEKVKGKFSFVQI